ncbi:TIGR03862 family flavoprotein [Cognatishimia sp. F0-27]|uniref:TIGR03862 family flavoprotein n=1 Tax=Cognatishimia sp. F0-27 TaxID=2816855 RepID=UPI001D0C2E01|nr:TIGR03862 family flavoprotein [Cognatishimia sp. F0-27]MCC1494466.1 TIGR03862 family flavoprotein [Cognatishimia sp. F0-27]
MDGVLVIGGGPAGLMAAQAVLDAGQPATLVEAKPSIGRKFLMAGKSGLNLTKMQAMGPFLASYGLAEPRLRAALRAFGPAAVRDWADGLGQNTFTGSTGRLFPAVMKASPLLRAWLERLDAQGLTRHTRWRWQGWATDDALRFDTPEGHVTLRPHATVLALGGGSWARLGSDGTWRHHFAEQGLESVPFAASNAGLVVAWSPAMARHFGAPLKAVAFRSGDAVSRGEAILSARGLEGGGLYPLSAAIRNGKPLSIDLAPDRDLDTVRNRLARPRGKASMSNHLRKALGLSPVAIALLNEFARPLPTEADRLARLVKAVPVSHQGLRPLDEAISTVGGVPWTALDDGLMLIDKPGTFCAGEMIDWDAPTGGYLLSACFATGRLAGETAARWAG